MRYAPQVGSLLLALLVSGCASLSGPFSEPLERGESVPPGKVLLIGNFVMDPPVKQGPLAVRAPRGTHQDVIKLFMTRDLRGSIDMSKAFGNPVDEAMDVSMRGLSAVPLVPGTRYVRAGTVMKRSTVQSNYVAPTPHMRTANAATIDAQFVTIVKDIKLDIPANAKAVYIGTIVFKHNGNEVTRVYVRNQYQSAMRELRRLNLSGVSTRNVVKKLAVPIK